MLLLFIVFSQKRLKPNTREKNLHNMLGYAATRMNTYMGLPYFFNDVAQAIFWLLFLAGIRKRWLKLRVGLLDISVHRLSQ